MKEFPLIFVLFSLAQLVIAVVLIVYFIRLCGNVARIRRQTEQCDVYDDCNISYRFNTLLAMGLKEEARKYLIDAILNYYHWDRRPTINDIRAVLDRFETPLKQVGIAVDENFFLDRGEAD